MTYPYKYKKAFDALFDFYLTYEEIYDLSINPNDSFPFFYNRINYLQSKCAESFSKIKFLFLAAGGKDDEASSKESIIKKIDDLQNSKVNVENLLEKRKGPNLHYINLQTKLFKKIFSFREIERLAGVPKMKRRDSLGREVWIYPSEWRGFQDCVFFLNGKVVETKKELGSDIENSKSFEMAKVVIAN